MDALFYLNTMELIKSRNHDHQFDGGHDSLDMWFTIYIALRKCETGYCELLEVHSIPCLAFI